jgi:NADPH-dependent glutamate synthase beta subunit-like oxidoreductase
LDIRSYLEKLSKGRWGPAYKTYRNAVVFPAIVSALCDQPCRAHCQRVLIGDEALAMRDIEAACVKHTKNRKPELYIIPPKTQRIAVIGAGPAGLSCALNLAQKKFPITIFEKENGWGGSLRSSSKFAEFDADIALQFSSVKVEFRFESEIKSLDELAEFEIIFIATGSGGNSFGLGDSWDPELLSTSNPKTLMGGALCGATLMEGIAQGVEASKTRPAAPMAFATTRRIASDTSSMRAPFLRR